MDKNGNVMLQPWREALRKSCGAKCENENCPHDLALHLASFATKEKKALKQKVMLDVMKVASQSASLLSKIESCIAKSKAALQNRKLIAKSKADSKIECSIAKSKADSKIKDSLAKSNAA